MEKTNSLYSIDNILLDRAKIPQQSNRQDTMKPKRGREHPTILDIHHSRIAPHKWKYTANTTLQQAIAPSSLL
jgi:hypothetical protein